jgi:hypothetical protein
MIETLKVFWGLLGCGKNIKINGIGGNSHKKTAANLKPPTHLSKLLNLTTPKHTSFIIP